MNFSGRVLLPACICFATLLKQCSVQSQRGFDPEHRDGGRCTLHCRHPHGYCARVLEVYDHCHGYSKIHER
ncbi:hypothetical protein B0H16DRAFT_1551076 [Mycena metata]|uniref:Secreted protein n=1 Tax=Mycena metata TaxID=1033252 RepID=A0AAD7N7A6_9AGAR|nr:hypothetical protein B0H16DRAFT_1551076 [Mycena metata]